MSKITEGLDKAIAHQVQNIVRQNPAGSAAERQILNHFIASHEGVYAQNIIGSKNSKNWIKQAMHWLQLPKVLPHLKNKYPEVDFSDLEELAHRMHEDWLARIGQLEENLNEFLDTGGGGDDGDDELKRQVIEMYFEDGLRETEISRITGLSEVAVHNIIDQYERGDFKLDETVINEYNTNPIDDIVQRLPKGLTVNNFAIPAFKEYLFLKYYTAEKPNWKELSGPFAQEYRQKHGIKEYKLGDLNYFDDMLTVLPKGLTPEQLNVQGFKEFIYQKHGSKEWPDFKKNRYAYWDAYQKAGGSKKPGLVSKIKSTMGIDENLLNTYGDQLGIDEADDKPSLGTLVQSILTPPAPPKPNVKDQPKESSIMKGLQAEEIKKRRDPLSAKDKKLIAAIWGMDERGMLQDKSRYLVYTANNRIEADEKTLDDALEQVDLIYSYNKVLDYPIVIYDRKSKTPLYFNGYEDYIQKVQPLKHKMHEEQDFKSFLNKSLTNKVEPTPKGYDPNTTMGFHNMPGYKNALDFGLAIISKMDDKTKKYYAARDEEVLEDYLLKIARRNNLLIKEFSAPTDDDHAEVFRGGKFYEEDLFEVPGLFDEVFHDPNIGSSWVDLLKDSIKEGYSDGAQGGSGIGIEASPIVQAYQNQIDEHINTPGGMGQSYRKFKPKVAGTKESSIMKGLQEFQLDKIVPDERPEEFWRNLAAQWKFGKPEERANIEKTLKQMHYVIGDDMRYNPDGVYITGAKDYKGKSYMSWSIDELKNIEESWSKKYKKSINCNNPKGFSQKAHCAGRKARQAGKHTKSSSVSEYKEVDTQRKIVFSKENPPDLYYLYQQFIQRMLNPENTIDPNEWIDKVNKHYGLNYTWKDYQKRGHNDQTNNWQKIVNKYIVNKK